MNRTELYASYAQKVVEDMDIDSLMDAVADHIEARLEDLPEVEAIEEIEQSAYADLLDQYDEESSQ